MEPYIGIVVFEMSKKNKLHFCDLDSARSDSESSGAARSEPESSPSERSPSETGSFFREDIYIVYADSDADAYAKVEALAHEQESTPEESARSGDFVTVRHIVDAAPALYGRVDKDIDLYSRHFASLEDYKRFEMKLGGTDPFAES